MSFLQLIFDILFILNGNALKVFELTSEPAFTAGDGVMVSMKSSGAVRHAFVADSVIITLPEEMSAADGW